MIDTHERSKASLNVLGVKNWFVDNTVNFPRVTEASKEKAIEAFVFEIQPYSYLSDGLKCSWLRHSGKKRSPDASDSCRKGETCLQSGEHEDLGISGGLLVLACWTSFGNKTK